MDLDLDADLDTAVQWLDEHLRNTLESIPELSEETAEPDLLAQATQQTLGIPISYGDDILFEIPISQANEQITTVSVTTTTDCPITSTPVTVTTIEIVPTEEDPPVAGPSHQGATPPEAVNPAAQVEEHPPLELQG